MQIVWGRVVHLGESCLSLSASPTTASSQASVNDIGLIIKTNMDIDPVHDVIAALSKNQKHELIFNRQSPPLTFSAHSHMAAIEGILLIGLRSTRDSVIAHIWMLYFVEYVL